MQAGLRDMMRFYRGLYPKFDQERFEKLREVFALDEKRPLRRMSKGQQKQAASGSRCARCPTISSLTSRWTASTP